MNIRILLLVCSLMILAAVANAQQQRDKPLVIGDDPPAMTSQGIQAIDLLVHTLGLPPKTSRLWMLRRFDQGKGDVWIEAHLWPRVFTHRLVRARMAACNNFKPPNIRHGSPIMMGWSLANEGTEETAFVAPTDRPFTVVGPFTDRITVTGELADEDLIAVVDAVRRLHPAPRSFRIVSTEEIPGVTPATCEVLGLPPVGSDDEWVVQLIKEGMDWIVTKSVEDRGTEEHPLPLHP